MLLTLEGFLWEGALKFGGTFKEFCLEELKKLWKLITG